MTGSIDVSVRPVAVANTENVATADGANSPIAQPPAGWHDVDTIETDDVWQIHDIAERLPS